MRVNPTGQGLGATIEGIDLADPIATGATEEIVAALGRYGVLCFPRQQLSSRALRDFSARFGELEIHVANVFQEPDLPEVMILSNVKENGKPIGLADAGQGWHTDMSYSRMIAFANVLHALKVPRRDGVPLGSTEFSNMQAAYADLPAAVKERIEPLTATHDFSKFWEMMRLRPGST